MPSIVEVVRKLGFRDTGKALRSRAWSDSVSFGLASSLTDLPEPRPAKIPVDMAVREPRTFRGFDDESARVAGGDRVEVEQRRRLCAAGANQLYVATAENGDAIYAQWLFHPGGQAPLEAVTPNQFPPLKPGETLVEGAYTFVNYRKLGAMAVGMNQLLVAARESGANKCFTYVSADNIPSLRGCANVGFGLDHVRVTRQRLGRRQATYRPPTDAERAVWDAAIAPKG